MPFFPFWIMFPRRTFLLKTREFSPRTKFSLPNRLKLERMLLPRFHMCLKTTNKIEEMFCIFLSEKRKQMLFIIRRKREERILLRVNLKKHLPFLVYFPFFALCWKKNVCVEKIWQVHSWYDMSSSSSFLKCLVVSLENDDWKRSEYLCDFFFARKNLVVDDDLVARLKVWLPLIW